MGRSPIDAMVGNEPEDIVESKIYGRPVKQDEAAEDISREGGTSKLPSNIMPFSIKGAK